MSLLSIFKSTIPSINYIFKSGKVATFRRRGDDPAGQYLTNDPDELVELQKEVKTNHPHIYVDANDSEVEENLADPQVAKEAAMYDRIRAQVIAELGDPNQPYTAIKDFGQTEARAQLGGIANSVTLAGTTVENDLQNANSPASQNALAEQLALLAKQKAAASDTKESAAENGEKKADDASASQDATQSADAASKLKINLPK